MKAKNEPVIINGLVTGLITAVFAVLAAFDVWEPTEEQITAVFGLVTIVIAIGAYLTRRQTYGPITVKESMKPSPEDIGPGGIGPAAIQPPGA